MLGIFATAVTAITTAVTTAVSTIGPAVSSFAAKVGPMIAGAMDKIPSIFGRITDFASTFLGVSGVFKPDDNVQDVGEAALQASRDNITPDRFDDFDDYMEELRNYEIDPKVAEERSSIEKTVAGMGVGGVGLEQKYDAEPGSFKDIWLLPLANPEYFTPERMKTIISEGTLVHNLDDYFNDKLTDTEATELKQEIDSRLQEGANNLDASTDLYKALDETEEKLHEISETIEKS